MFRIVNVMTCSTNQNFSSIIKQIAVCLTPTITLNYCKHYYHENHYKGFDKKLYSHRENLIKNYNNNFQLNAPIESIQNNLRKFSAKVVHSNENLGILKKVLSKVGFNGILKARLKIASYILYENVADKINYLEFFKEFNLPNTFNSWFLVTELHVWMLLLRVMAEGSETGGDGRFLRNNIVEAMWGDVNTRAKKLGAHNPSGTKAQIEILSEQFQAALVAYDEGIMSDDKILAAALWRRFFEQDCNNYLLLEKLVRYVRQQVQMLDLIHRNDLILKPKIQWTPINKI